MRNKIKFINNVLFLVLFALNIKTAYSSNIGLYQFDANMLKEINYYKDESNMVLSAEWQGKWTGKNGIDSLDDFLNNPEMQTKAVKEYHKKLWEIYLKDYHKHEGKTIKNILLTKSGMISVAHIFGVVAVKEFIDSQGQIDKKDSNGMPCSEYLIGYQGYDLKW